MNNIKTDLTANSTEEKTIFLVTIKNARFVHRIFMLISLTVLIFSLSPDYGKRYRIARMEAEVLHDKISSFDWNEFDSWWRKGAVKIADDVQEGIESAIVDIGFSSKKYPSFNLYFLISNNLDEDDYEDNNNENNSYDFEHVYYPQINDSLEIVYRKITNNKFKPIVASPKIISLKSALKGVIDEIQNREEIQQKYNLKEAELSEFKITKFYKSRKGRNAQTGITPEIPALVQYKMIITAKKLENENSMSLRSRSKIRTSKGNAAIEFHDQEIHLRGTIEARTVELINYTPWNWFSEKTLNSALWREQGRKSNKLAQKKPPQKRDFLPNLIAIWNKVHKLPLPEVLFILPELEVNSSKELKVFGISVYRDLALILGPLAILLSLLFVIANMKALVGTNLPDDSGWIVLYPNFLSKFLTYGSYLLVPILSLILLFNMADGWWSFWIVAMFISYIGAVSWAILITNHIQRDYSNAKLGK